MDRRWSWGTRVALALIAAKVFLHLALIQRYGVHGDELYFIECGRHLAFGYVDHAPLVPWIAGAIDALNGPQLWALRLPAVVAGAASMAAVAWMVRVWGGGGWAQAMAGLAMLFAPALLRMGSMLDIPVIELAFCSIASALVAYILAPGDHHRGRWWWLVGLVLGLALLTKHSVLIYGLGLFVGLAVGAPHALRDRRPWLAGLLALAFLVPNLLWQIEHDWPTVAFLRAMSEGTLARIPAVLFLGGQLLYFGLLATPLWLAGLVSGLRPGGERFRPFAVLHLVALVVLLTTHGKPYYLAFAYPPLFAAGAVSAERWLHRRPKLRAAYVGVLAVSGVALALLVLPALPVRTVDHGVDALTFGKLPEQALTHDLHGEHGWQRHAEVIDRVLDDLPPESRDRTVLLVGSYSQAGALNVLRADPHPRAFSGHMSHFHWGPPPAGQWLITYGIPLAQLDGVATECRQVARIRAPLARVGETDLAVHRCRIASELSERWAELRRFGH